MDICLGLVLTYIGYKCLILTAISSLLTWFQESKFSSYDALRNKPPLFGTLDCSVLLEVLKNKSPFLTNSGSLDALKNKPLERLDARRNNPPLLKILEKFIINFEYVGWFQNRRILGFHNRSIFEHNYTKISGTRNFFYTLCQKVQVY